MGAVSVSAAQGRCRPRASLEERFPPSPDDRDPRHPTHLGSPAYRPKAKGGPERKEGHMGPSDAVRPEPTSVPRPALFQARD